MRFEEGMTELETMVRQMESGDLPLEESFALYEKASALLKELQKLLEKHEQRVKLLTQDGEEDIHIEVTEE
ncbi:MAG: exodeoxyribonuclease VII small subunit [Christensenellales bacterium]|jgi:exodeoxyribonuclease VII small subunit